MNLLKSKIGVSPFLLSRYFGEKLSNVSITDYKYLPKVRPLSSTSAGKRMIEILDRETEAYKKWDDVFADTFLKAQEIRISKPQAKTEPTWINGWFPGLDSFSLIGMLAKYKPKKYLEVGSGNSTKFARWAIDNFSPKTKLISIDPFPRAEIDSICDQIVRYPLEDVDQKYFTELEAGDILFVDNSHRSFQNSDVTVFFTEILPELNPGVVYGIHDIFIPADYPPTWESRFYNEQYLLMSYIFGGAAGDKIIFPTAHITGKFAELLPKTKAFYDQNLPEVDRHGGAFWMVKA